MKLGLWLALACVGGAVWAQMPPQVPPQAPAAPPAADLFFAKAAMGHVRLSPSGRWLAALSTLPGQRTGLLVIDLEGREPPRRIQAPGSDDIAWLRWASDDWLLFSLEDKLQSRNARLLVYSAPGLMAIRRDGSDERQLVARGSSDAPNDTLSAGHAYVGLGKPGSLDVILSNGRRLVTMNVATRTSKPYHDDAPRADRWWLDPQGRPRLILQEDEDALRILWADAKGDQVGPWREIGRRPLLSPGWSPVYVEGDNLFYVELANGSGYSELRRFDFEAGRPAAQALLATPGFSPHFFMRSAERGGAAIGVDVALDALTTEWFTPEMKALQAKVDARWPDRVNMLQCRPCAGTPDVVLVASYSDRDPGRYLVYRPQQDRWQLLGEEQPDIDPARMARTEFVRIKARDGQDLPLWVTKLPATPPGAPAVVMVHGGPHLRGRTWSWEPESQFLASRGYVVIEPEFRGSTGYGELHELAGWKQWGGGMIDDITDALQHSVSQGWVDPGRVCIMGASYGGYATLMSLVKEPGRYRCGIAHAAVTDMRHRFDFHWSDASRFTRRKLLPLTMGDPKADAQMMIATSPLEQAGRIQAPVLLVHGDDDYRVPIENGERMRDALKKLGKPVEWVKYVDEGHGFIERKNLIDYWRRVEAFLARHLAAAPAAPAGQAAPSQRSISEAGAVSPPSRENP